LVRDEAQPVELVKIIGSDKLKEGIAENRDDVEGSSKHLVLFSSQELATPSSVD